MKVLKRYWVGSSSSELWETMEAARLHGHDTFYRRHVELFEDRRMIGDVVRVFGRFFVFHYSNEEMLRDQAPAGYLVVHGLSEAFAMSRHNRVVQVIRDGKTRNFSFPRGWVFKDG